MKQWPKNPAYERAFALFNAGARDEAERSFAEAIAAQPERARIFSNLSVLLLQTERVDDALRAAERGAALAEIDDGYPHALLAEARSAAGDHHGAIEAADEALARAAASAPDRARAAYAKAWALIQLDDGRQAFAVLADVDEGKDAAADATLYVMRAVARACSHRFGEAQRLIEKARALDPDNSDAADRARSIADGLAIARDAVADAEAEAQRRPRRWEAWHALGVALTMAGDLADAALVFDRAHAVKGDRWPAEPTMLSPMEVDCRLALLADPASPTRVLAPLSKPAARKKTNKRRRRA